MFCITDATVALTWVDDKRMANSLVSDSQPDFDPELIADFRAEFQDAGDIVQGILVALESAADSHEHLHALFRALHSIKSNLRMMQLNVLSEFIHVLENILDDMREERINYDNRFSDIVLLSLEQVQDVFTAMFAGDVTCEHRLDPLQRLLENIHADHANIAQHFQAALCYLDPGLVDSDANAQKQHLSDLEFFGQFAAFIENRLDYEPGSMQRILTMAEQLNALAGQPVEVEQLRAAVYMHDSGMAFLSSAIFRKESELSGEEKLQLQRHVNLAADLLEHLAIWEEACQIVRQHHERFDGEGYPNQLSGGQICAGAKLLAIVDTFDAMTHKRAHREQRRTVLRAVAEINAQAGKQFDPAWVELFNTWIRHHYLHKSA